MYGRERHNKGGSMVELALLLPLLVLILAGVVDLGRAFRDYIIITNVAREGARYASLHADPSFAVDTKQAAIDEAQASGITLTPSNVTLTLVPADPDPGQIGTATITVTYRFNLIVGRIFGTSVITMQRGIQMAAIGR